MRYLFLLILLTSSCGPIKYPINRRNISIVVDKEFSTNERMNIISACNNWESAVNYMIKFNLTFIEVNRNWQTDNISTIYKAEGWKKFMLPYKFSNNIVALTYYDIGDIFIIKTNWKFKKVVEHELGHFLMKSAWHSFDKGSVMFPNVGDDIKEQEINMVKEVYK